MSRRGLLVLTAGAGAAITVGAAGWSRRAGASTGRVLASTVPLPRPFLVPLPVPPVARPVRSEHGTDFYEVEQREGKVEILPGRKTTVWGYDGTFPGPTFAARSGRRTLVQVRNSLTVPTVTHLHGGVTPPESDGYPADLLLPTRCAPGRTHDGMAGAHPGRTAVGYRTYEYPLPQPAATLWYHDHRMDFSAPQVWRGLAGFFLISDQEEDRLPLPGGDRDVPLMLCDRSFAEDGSFRYPDHAGHDAFPDGVLGDVQLVNGAPWPVLDVSATRYRFRLLNASNARRYGLRLTAGDGKPGRFIQIGSDGGLLAAPRPLDIVGMAPGERFDVIVDFSAFPVGSKVTLRNSAAEGGMRDVMRFHVVRKEKEDSRVPSRLSTSFETLSPGPGRSVPVRSFDFRRTHSSDERQMWTINGRPFSTDTVLASPRLGSVERWRFSSDFHHPVHAHLAQFQVTARGSRPPRATDAGWKDTVDVRPYEVVDVLVRFAGYKGRYMLHCHNLEHEDMAMMANFDVT
ncbi:multicopper oxidase family protein [Streptomyces roseoverticillatus]|uniref:multicopper oxidase family protein n=1 Tax=Streptomyces roseoverticillatus TaxID=66429 RepID=UPI001F33369F|nr:multicopper oxidase family protein [Streptomyces roseoverticillatus]MCF3102256.1 multicopper oxidase family protein [Streptomyces roseoverticillatus]